ncbi:aggrecan core protein-like [Mya arenaria]|uniref:aggrecan core protein-like n=1 Tax=Mya arenaria TaxID=6604 RepID=UPI0022E85269|nr:aggrecan core protein-like [Mya arenaria]
MMKSQPSVFVKLYMLAVSILLCGMVRCDYACICNYNVESAVYLQENKNSKTIGYLYEFDCKPSYGQLRHGIFFQIQFEGQVGYVEDNSQIMIQTCPGSVPTQDQVSTSAPTTTDIAPNITQISTTTSIPRTTSKGKPLTDYMYSLSTTSFLNTTIYTVINNTDITTNNQTTYIPIIVHTTTTSQNESFPPSTIQNTFPPSTNQTTSVTPSTSHKTTLTPSTNQTTAFTPTISQTSPFPISISPKTSFTPSTSQATTLTSSTVQTTIFTPSIPPTTSMTSPTTTTTLKPLPTTLKTSTTTTFEMLTTTPLRTCKSGWVHHGDSCYLFSHDTEDWSMAQLICRLLGGNLAEVRTQSEKLFIRQTASTRRVKFWIGANDLSTEGEFRWAGSDRRVTITDWHSGQPDNYEGAEDCVHTDGERTGTWNDEDCDERMHYICEERLLEPPHGPSSSLIG